jgi:hypothetical protein
LPRARLPNARKALPLLVALLAAVLPGAPDAARSASCELGLSDVVCRLKPTLRVSWGSRSPKTIRSANGTLLRPGSRIQLERRGAADVYFRQDAFCSFSHRRRDSTGATTRQPRGFLFTQRQGDSVCTVAGRPLIRVKAGERFPRYERSVRRSTRVRFQAQLRPDAAESPLSQFQVRYYPRSSFTVAVHRGRLIVSLPAHSPVSLDAGFALDVALTRANTIRDTDVRPARFSARDERAFGRQTVAWALLSVVVEGRGTVRSNPTGIDCGPDCERPFGRDAVVRLVAVPAPSWDFAEWRGCGVVDLARCTVSMDEPRLVTARFVPAGTAATLTVTKAGGGGGTVTSAPPGIDCGSDCTHEYASGTIVTLTATPDPGSAFAGWSGCVSATNACSLTIDQARTVTANFVPAFTLTVGKAGNAGGRVVSAPPGIDCGSDCTEEYASGTIVTLTATPDPGSAFTSWSEDCSASCMVTMNQDRSVTATFGPGALLSRLWIPRIPTNRASSGSS